jgi:hypothetical protein
MTRKKKKKEEGIHILEKMVQLGKPITQALKKHSTCCGCEIHVL